MKWSWLTRHHLKHEVDPELDALVREYLEAAEARQERVDHVLKETQRQKKSNNFGPKVANALGARPR